MKKSKIYAIVSALVMLVSFAACEDYLDYEDKDVPEGESSVKVEVGFKSFSPALGRSAGETIKSIKTLWMVIYNADGSLYEAKPVTDFNVDQTRPNTRPDGQPSAEGSTGYASFNLTIPNGRYRMYAVANMSLAGRDVSTEEKLRNIRVDWAEDNVANNAEMFGWFVNGDRTTSRGSGFVAPEVVVGPGKSTLHAWLSRVASKITVAYDGENLAEGVSIYFKSVTIKDLPKSCALGAVNSVADSESLIATGEVLKYYDGDTEPVEADFLSGTYGAVVSKESPSFGSSHSDAEEALFFYENMQGVGPDKRQRKDPADDSKLEYTFKDGVPFGSYVEVEAFYRSVNQERPGCGRIIYRFMLGKDILTNYDAERNHHYKLTLMFNRFANDVDWHIDYIEQTLEVENPAVFNYRGEVFLSNTYDNLGHVFGRDNSIGVTSFTDTKTDGSAGLAYKPFDVEIPSDVDWLDYDIIDAGPGSLQGRVVFRIKQDKIIHKDISINESLNQLSGGSTKGAAVDLASGGNTANCYVVDGYGWFKFPLVYGNALKGNGDNKESYVSSLSNPDYGKPVLVNFKNHLNKPIESPYIRDHEGCGQPHGASLVWQDEQNLVSGIEYDANAYGGKGGIVFKVKEDISQGNAVVALTDANGKAMWSWHIWVTSFKGLEETVTVSTSATRGHGVGWPQPETMELMPVNLGWCSLPGDVITYYPRRECKVKISSKDLSRTITVVQESHMAFPQGNNTYYQWGRKDPFYGTNANWQNKTWYDATGAAHVNQTPRRLFWDTYDVGVFPGEDRKTTIELFEEAGVNRLIQYPGVWHNPTRKELSGGGYRSENAVYANLWGGTGDAWAYTTIKTVYDPCPAGYAVPHYAAYSGFTADGQNQNVDNNTDSHLWYDVKVETSNPSTNRLFEFYVNSDKTKSIIFPVTGYRDWDGSATVNWFANNEAMESIGYVWARPVNNYQLTDNVSDAAYNFEFSRTSSRSSGGETGFVRPQNAFNTCNGLPVRPVRM